MLRSTEPSPLRRSPFNQNSLEPAINQVHVCIVAADPADLNATFHIMQLEQKKGRKPVRVVCVGSGNKVGQYAPHLAHILHSRLLTGLRISSGLMLESHVPIELFPGRHIAHARHCLAPNGKMARCGGSVDARIVHNYDGRRSVEIPSCTSRPAY
ncbi:hypothetical protein BC628DRAFT_852992 [Trametes gibbosa]|nr:hypothetical protein BC628DRAFT_852992 [Trametes gibbosa]